MNNNYTVIKANKSHIIPLQKFVKKMTEEADMIFPALNLNKASKYGLKMIKDGSVVCLVHDKEIVGSVCGAIVKWWFADAEYLTEQGFWIEKEHRNIETASMLLKAFKGIADKNTWAKRKEDILITQPNGRKYNWHLTNPNSEKAKKKIAQMKEIRR